MVIFNVKLEAEAELYKIAELAIAMLNIMTVTYLLHQSVLTCRLHTQIFDMYFREMSVNSRIANIVTRASHSLIGIRCFYGPFPATKKWSKFFLSRPSAAFVSYWFQELLHKPESQFQQQQLNACLFLNATLKVANCTTKCFLSKGNSSKGKAN